MALQVSAPTAALVRNHSTVSLQVATTPVVRWWYASADGATRGTATSAAGVPAGYFVERITRT